MHRRRVTAGPLLEGQAWEASTSRGVPTHRKRLRPAERVETESASDRAVETCEVHGPPASPAGQNGAKERRQRGDMTCLDNNDLES